MYFNVAMSPSKDGGSEKPTTRVILLQGITNIKSYTENFDYSRYYRGENIACGKIFYQVKYCLWCFSDK